MTRALDIAGWRVAHIGFADDGLVIAGLEVWKQAWRASNASPVDLPHPAHPHQIHGYDIHEIGDASHPVRFAVCELSNGVWGFYVPVGDPVASDGCSADGTLRYEHRLGDLVNGRYDAVSASAVLIDAADGRVIVDCAAWTSSRIATNADGSLSLHLQQNGCDVLFGINPATQRFCNVVEPGPALPLSRLADAVERARLATIRHGASPMFRHISPDGTICVDLAAVEWSNSHWVNAPRVSEIASGRIVLDLWNTDWDASVAFPGCGRVRLGFRRYRHGGNLAAELDLIRNTCEVFIGPGLQDALPEAPLDDIASVLEGASLRADGIAALATGGHGSSHGAVRPNPLTAWRTALLILVGALVAIAAATYWTMQHAAASKPKLDTVPAMPK